MLSVALAIYLMVGLIVGVVIAPTYKFMSDSKRTYVQLIILTYPIWFVLKITKHILTKICKAL